MSATQEVKQKTSVTLTEIETLQLRLEASKLRELEAVLANLRTQYAQTQTALKTQQAQCKALRDRILTANGLDPAATDYEITETETTITIARKNQ